MSTFLSLTVYGLADGAILALAALGFVLIYKATQVINFAQGEMAMFATFIVWMLHDAGLRLRARDAHVDRARILLAVEAPAAGLHEVVHVVDVEVVRGEAG